jgi:xanthine dehydrogenase accessory factor
MRELQAILEAIQESRRGGKTAILATVVQVEGSAYRQPGARMLLTEDGWRAGAVSGGCLEGDLLVRAWQLTASGDAVLASYDTTAESDIVFGAGVGCRGVVRILLERLVPGREPDSAAFLHECLQRREAGVLATIFRRDGEIGVRVGARLRLSTDGRATGDIEDAELAARIEQDARQALASRRSAVMSYTLRAGAATAFIEVIKPPVPLVVFGAGQDALPMVRLAKELGWHVTVVDARPAYVTRERFPQADEVILCPPEAIRRSVRLGTDTVAVVMTHNYLQDQRLLEALLPSPIRYLGLLGPRSRTERLLSALRADGFVWNEGQTARLFAPVGLDIGADGPEEIALAVLAEIQAALAGRSGAPLRQRRETIHGEEASGVAGPTSDEPGEMAEATCGRWAS